MANVERMRVADFVVDGKYWHRGRKERGMFTDETKRLTELSCEPSTVHLDFGGEILEVTAAMVHALADNE